MIKTSLSGNTNKTNTNIIEYSCIKWTSPRCIFPCRLFQDPLTQPFTKAGWKHQSSFLMQNGQFLWSSRTYLYLKVLNKSIRRKLPFIYLPVSSLPFSLLLLPSTAEELWPMERTKVLLRWAALLVSLLSKQSVEDHTLPTGRTWAIWEGSTDRSPILGLVFKREVVCANTTTQSVPSI